MRKIAIQFQYPIQLHFRYVMVKFRPIVVRAEDRKAPPDFVNLIPIRKTRSGLQFTCAAPTLGLNAHRLKDVWVCNSDGYVGQVSFQAGKSRSLGLIFVLVFPGLRAEPPAGADGDLLQRGVQRQDPLHRLRAAALHQQQRGDDDDYIDSSNEGAEGIQL